MAPKTDIPSKQKISEQNLMRHKPDGEKMKRVKQQQALEDLRRRLPHQEGRATEMSTLLQATSYIAHPNKMLNEPENVHPWVLQNTVSNIVNRQIWDAKNFGGDGNTSRLEQMDTSGSESGELSHKQKRAIERNQRERQRMSRLNSAFDDLRNRLPSNGEKKISKKETLLKAIEYISHLNQVLQETENVVPMDFNATMLLEEVRKHWSMTM